MTEVRPTKRAWQNRIVGHGEVAPSDLRPHPLNARRHPGSQRDALRGALHRLGWVSEVIVNERTGYMLDGHLRVEEAVTKGEPTVPVTYVDLSEEEERLVIASLDPIAAMAEYDRVKLDDLVRDLRSGDAGLDALLDALSSERNPITFDDRMAEWQGMPEFLSEDKMAYRRIVVQIATPEALEEFSRMVGQPIGPQQSTMWIPPEAKDAQPPRSRRVRTEAEPDPALESEGDEE